MRIKQFALGICALVLAVMLARCSSNNNPPTTGSPTPTPTPSNPNPTRFAKRVLLSNQTPLGGDVLIIDGLHDILARQTVAATQPGKMVTANGETAIMSTSLPQVTIFNNPGEVVFFTPTMEGQPFDIAITSDGKTVFVAIKNVGMVEAVDTATGNIVASIPVPTPARLVMSPQGTKLLVFSDDPQTITPVNAFFVIDVASVAAHPNAACGVSSPVCIPISGGGLDQPYTAVFNASETQAFILNCGPECGGTQASVIRVDFSNASTPTLTAPEPVKGATTGLLSGGNLFVAGTAVLPPGTTTPCNFSSGNGACGTLSVLNASTVSVTSTFPITDGVHGVMAMSSASHLYIGARGCTVGSPSAQNTVQSCLSIFNTGSNAMVPPLPVSAFRPNFNVTSLQQISGRNVLYVVQGFGLDIFDTTTDAVSTTISPFNIPGDAAYVLQIDP